MGWSYIKSSLTGDEQIGPVSQPDFAQAVLNGTVTPTTKINHLKQTNGMWVDAAEVPFTNRLFQHIKEKKVNAQAEAEQKRAKNVQLKAKKKLDRQREKELQKNDRQRESNIQNLNDKRQRAWGLASSSKANYYFVGWGLIVLSCLGFAFGIFYWSFAETVFQEISSFLVLGFSAVSLGIGVTLFVLIEISMKLGSAFYLQNTKDDLD
jgi:hypothetical protein